LKKYRIQVEDRKEIVRLLEKAKQRSISRALGVGQATVHRDRDPNGSKADRKSLKSKDHNASIDPNGSSDTDWFQSPPDEDHAPLGWSDSAAEGNGWTESGCKRNWK
jgi:hypothetical protein